MIEPIEGVHFDVTVMDFASLYPSIIKVNNLSYETVRCPHEECKENSIPGTAHWACTKKNGLTSLIHRFFTRFTGKLLQKPIKKRKYHR